MNDSTHTISTTEVAERIIDSINDYQSDGLITGMQYRTKTGYKNVLRAINHADREVCLNLVVNRLVVVYVPPNTSSIPFSFNKHNTGKVIESINALSLPVPNNIYFLQKLDYLQILEINDRLVSVHDSYPTGQEDSTEVLRKISSTEFFNHTVEREGRYFLSYNLPGYGFAPEEKVCTFIPDENRLVIADGYSTAKFLRFRARIQAGIFNVANLKTQCIEEKDYNQYKIVAPLYALEYLIEEAIYRLLPKSSLDAKRIANADRQDQKQQALALRPTDRNVIVPYSSFG